MDDDDPMVFLQQQRAKLAAMSEMAVVAQAQEAVALNVQRRMRKIDALLNGGGTVDSTSYPAASASTPPTTTIAQHFPTSAAGLSGDEEVEYWKRKIAILSQPVTAEGLAPPGTNYHHQQQQQQQSNYNQPSFSSSSSSSSSPSNIAQKMQDMSLQQPNHTNYSNHSNYSNSPSPLRRQHSPPQQRQQSYQPPQLQSQSYASQSSPSPRQPNHTFGHKTNEPVRQSPARNPVRHQARNQKPMRSPGRGGGEGNPNNHNNNRTQYGQTPSPSNARKSRHHHGEPVSLVPEGFPPTPPGWKRARDKKSGRYYLYRGSETTWETDRTGRRYKK
jgi:hypothetical protein